MSGMSQPLAEAVLPDPSGVTVDYGNDETPVIPPSQGSLRSRTLRGSAWTIGGYGVSNVLRIAGNLVLTRLLFPDVFGLMFLVYVFIQGLSMFSDVGIGPAIVQSHRGDDPKFLRTAWTIQCFRGFALWLCSCALAWPVSRFYHQPMMAWLLPVAALNALIMGLESTSTHTLQRHLSLGRLTLVEISGQIVGIFATVCCAAIDRYHFGPNHPAAVWAIVGGTSCGALTRTILSHTVLPGIRHRLEWDRESVKLLFSFGRWIFVSTLLTFLAAQADGLIFGKLIPLNQLGIYRVAAMLALVPKDLVSKLGAAVVFPAYSRICVSGGDLKRLFGRVRVPFLIGGAAVVSGLIACGPPLIRILYDYRYESAGWMVQFLAVMVWFQILECTNSAALLARGNVNWMAAGSASKVAGMLLLIPLGFHMYGFPGALVALVLSEVVKYITAAVGIAIRGLQGFAGDAAFSAAIAAVAGAAIGCQHMVGAANGHKYRAFAVTAVIAGGIWAAVALAYWRRERAGHLSRTAPNAPDGAALTSKQNVISAA